MRKGALTTGMMTCNSKPVDMRGAQLVYGAGCRLRLNFGPPNCDNGTPPTPSYAELDTGAASPGEVPISMLLDLPLSISIELGRTRMTVQEILRLGRGSVIQLERMAGEPVDIYVGDRRFAEGEVVVISEHFGIRVTRIISGIAGIEAAA